jgi:hypothetical protein
VLGDRFSRNLLYVAMTRGPAIGVENLDSGLEL